MMDEDEIEPRYLPLQRFERVELLDEASREPKTLIWKNSFIEII